MTKFLFYKFYLPFMTWISYFFPKDVQKNILMSLIKLNNKIILTSRNNMVRKLLVLLPRCLQYFHCNFNLISSIDNCQNCGRCKIKDIILLKEKYNIEIKVAPGGSLAKKFVEEISPEFVVAVACNQELISGIKEVYPCKVYAIPVIIIDKPCINTDTEISEIEKIVKDIVVKS